MKKLISSFLVGAGIMNSIPNINAMHFTSGTKSNSETNESCLKSIDLKSALLGAGVAGGLVGVIGIPVAAVIGTLVGKTKNTEKSNKNIKKSSDALFELVKLENSEYAEQLDGFLSFDYKEKFDEENIKIINDNIEFFVSDTIKDKDMKIESEEDLNFKEIFSVYRYKDSINYDDSINDDNRMLIIPDKDKVNNYDIIVILLEDGNFSRYLVFDINNKDNCNICCYVNPIKKVFRCTTKRFYGSLLLGRIFDDRIVYEIDNYMVACKGYKLGTKSE